MSSLLAIYIHDLSPFLVRFTETVGIRWYGLAYIAGFFFGFLLLRSLVRRGCCELQEDKVADFITLGAIFGVMLGGRLGYMLFYDLGDFLKNPMIFFNFLGGGMASHGGILGLTIYTWFYTRRHKLSWTGLGDNLVVIVPIGLFAGRIANFINGELYGRITSINGWWAMKFPDELLDGRLFPASTISELVRKAQTVDPAFEGVTGERFYLARLLIERARENEAVRAMIGEVLNPRHPSQIYQAIGEGLILFAVLIVVRLRWKNLYHGILTGLFFIVYALVRIGAEFFREPDAERIMGVTRGQFYSFFMIGIGVAFILWASKTKCRNSAAISKA